MFIWARILALSASVRGACHWRAAKEKGTPVITVIDYKAGNLTSVRLALEALGLEAVVTDDPARILEAERVIFPGVGAAGSAMETLRRLGLEEPIHAVAARGTPFLGICIGMQLLFDESEEDGGARCLGLVPGRVRRFQPVDPASKIPQMGWNTVRQARPHPIWAGIEDESEFYFVHSYYPAPDETAADTPAPNTAMAIGRTDYAGVRFCSAVARRNLVATQFHPEKSGRIGLRLLKNFCEWNGQC